MAVGFISVQLNFPIRKVHVQTIMSIECILYTQTHIHTCGNVDKYHFHMSTHTVFHMYSRLPNRLKLCVEKEDC